MDLLKSFSGSGGDEEKKKPAAATGHHEKHTKAEYFASAKVVADAAKSAASGGSAKIDKGKAAGAASDLLDGAEEYGKLNEKGYGSYVEKAQGYLHKYESDGPAKAKPAENHGEEKKTDSHSGGGAGDYLKMAQGFMGK